MLKFKAETLRLVFDEFNNPHEDFNIFHITAVDMTQAQKELEEKGYDVIRIWPDLQLV